MNKPMTTLMQKEVSRKEFLAMSGLAMASVFGMGGIIKLLTGHSLTNSLQRTGSGYGSSAYGGSRAK